MGIGGELNGHLRKSDRGCITLTGKKIKRSEHNLFRLNFSIQRKIIFLSKSHIISGYTS